MLGCERELRQIFDVNLRKRAVITSSTTDMIEKSFQICKLKQLLSFTSFKWSIYMWIFLKLPLLHLHVQIFFHICTHFFFCIANFLCLCSSSRTFQYRPLQYNTYICVCGHQFHANVGCQTLYPVYIIYGICNYGGKTRQKLTLTDNDFRLFIDSS